MSHHTSASVVVDRKSELLIIARRSRIRWVRSAGEACRDGASKKQMTLNQGQDKRLAQKATTDRKAPSFDTFQRTFDFLTDIIADGETVDIESLIQKNDMQEDDDASYDEARDEADVEASTVPVLGEISVEEYSYGMFLDALCSRSAVGIVKSMQQFISKFESRQRMRASGHRTGGAGHCYIDERINYEESLKIAEGIWIFLDHIIEEMMKSSVPLWHGSTELQRLTKTYCERFIFFKLYPSTFHNSFEDFFLNEKLFERIQSLSFLKPQHLDIKFISVGALGGIDPSSIP